MNCLNPFRTENRLNFHEKAYKNKDLGGILLSSKKNEVLTFNQYTKLDKMQYIIYADIESLIKKSRWINK